MEEKQAAADRKKKVERAKAQGMDADEIAAIVAEHEERLRGLVARFMTGEAAYTARPYPQFASKYGSYDHLARVLEWSLAGEEGEA